MGWSQCIEFPAYIIIYILYSSDAASCFYYYFQSYSIFAEDFCSSKEWNLMQRLYLLFEPSTKSIIGKLKSSKPKKKTKLNLKTGQNHKLRRMEAIFTFDANLSGALFILNFLQRFIPNLRHLTHSKQMVHRKKFAKQMVIMTITNAERFIL